jgi:hypothetical protein
MFLTTCEETNGINLDDNKDKKRVPAFYMKGVKLYSNKATNHCICSNNCTVISHNNTQTCGSGPKCFGIFSGIFREVLDKGNTIVAS